jgi:ADP-ribose pyrophosphatase
LILFEKRIDRVRNPRNGKVFERLVLESSDWVNVVALDEQRRSVMIRQYRFGVGYTILETPGGMVDPGEDSKTAAVRELLEETGYESDKWTYLGAVEPNPAFRDHLCHHWLAEDAERTREVLRQEPRWWERLFAALQVGRPDELGAVLEQAGLIVASGGPPGSDP